MGMEPVNIPVNNVTVIALLVLCWPLISFLFMAITPGKYRKEASILATISFFILALISIYLVIVVWPGETFQARIEWFNISDQISVTAGLLLNFEAAAMLVVVTLISAVVHLYSIKYMAEDAGYKKYFAFLGLFTFAMNGIVLTNNLLLIFMFWELVGLSSYLLIGHWYKKKTAVFAANKAFIVNRVADVGFIIGLAILWSQFKTLDLESLAVLMSESTLKDGLWISDGYAVSAGWLSVAGICLFIGAMGKSAQFPFQVWLPDAMEGPTPVSALIHAATMVAAGVFLMIRVFPLLDEVALTLMAFVGAITAFMGAVAALAQHDIKRVLAYSTISQLGYMLMGVGVGSYDAAFFHLFTHAFFKACLFLSAGSVIYALHQYSRASGKKFDAQDMRNMGGLRRYMPVTFVAFTISALALIGIPLFSGFLSKDALIAGAYGWAEFMSASSGPWYYIVPALGLFTIVLTAIYMARQLLLVFFDKFRYASESMRVPESPLIIRASIMLLAALSLGLVWSFNPLDFTSSWFLTAINIPSIVTPSFDALWQSEIFELSQSKHIIVSTVSISFILVGLGIGWILYKPGSAYVSSYATRPAAYNFFQRLSYYNWYLDPAYFNVFQQPLLKLARMVRLVEKRVINRAVDLFGILNVIFAHAIAWVDRAVVDGVVGLSVYVTGRVGRLSGTLQGGKVQNYILLAILGLLLLIIWII